MGIIIKQTPFPSSQSIKPSRDHHQLSKAPWTSSTSIDLAASCCDHCKGHHQVSRLHITVVVIKDNHQAGWHQWQSTTTIPTMWHYYQTSSMQNLPALRKLWENKSGRMWCMMIGGVTCSYDVMQLMSPFAIDAKGGERFRWEHALRGSMSCCHQWKRGTLLL